MRKSSLAFFGRLFVCTFHIGITASPESIGNVFLRERRVTSSRVVLVNVWRVVTDMASFCLRLWLHYTYEI